MDLTKIITVAGKSGLFRVVAQGRNALIAESLLDGKRTPVHTSLRVSTLEEIHMFTTGDDVPLKDILAKLHELEKGGESMDPKGEEGALWKKLEQVLPNADRERIYVSDVRKLFTWYGQLLKAGVFTAKDEEKTEEVSEKPKDEAKPKKTGAKPKAAVKKTAGPKPTSGGAPKAASVRRGGQRGS